MNQQLQMNFVKTDGKSARITVPNADNTLSAAEVKAAMEAVITAGVFAPGGADLAVAESAQLVTTETVVYDLEA